MLAALGEVGGLGQDAAQEGDERTLEEVLVSEVQEAPLRWLWVGRIPLGKLTLLDGDPGLGKSLLTLDLAAAQEG